MSPFFLSYRFIEVFRDVNANFFETLHQNIDVAHKGGTLTEGGWLSVLIFHTDVPTVLIILTELVLTVLVFLTEVLMMICTKLVLTALVF